jgi:hypothetical protein
MLTKQLTLFVFRLGYRLSRNKLEILSLRFSAIRHLVIARNLLFPFAVSQAPCTVEKGATSNTDHPLTDRLSFLGEQRSPSESMHGEPNPGEAMDSRPLLTKGATPAGSRPPPSGSRDYLEFNLP